MKILILYHPEFACASKFARKMSRILSNVHDHHIIYLDDVHKLIGGYFGANVIRHVKDQTLTAVCDVEKPTHAVIFDALKDPRFTATRATLSEKMPVRYIQDKITTVTNKDKGEHFDTYIGRGSPWGNPYAIGQDGDRDEVIRKFAYDFERDFLRGGPEFKKRLKDLKGAALGCHCKPYACHGDILASYLNQLDDDE